MSSMYIMEPVTSGKVCLNTTVGDIDVELWTRECPLACQNFIQHCLDGYYDGVIFHRLVRDFIIQTGDPTGTGQGGDPAFGEFFKSEFHQRLQFNRRGLLGMAGEEKDHNGSQFFFTLNSTPELNKKHTLFGKVAGDTVFNMLKLNDCDVDQNERPTRTHKIISTEVLVNPFKDLKPRQKRDEERRREQKQRKRVIDEQRRAGGAAPKQRNIGLLSFADEMEDEEEKIVGRGGKESSAKKFKSKSAHDVLEDDQLSKEKAVHADELGDRQARDEEKESGESSAYDLKRIRERMAAKRSHGGQRLVTQPLARPADHEDDELLDNVVEAQKDDDERAKLKELADELKTLQKEYVKTVRGPKLRKKENSEASLSAAMNAHNKMKLKFKTATKHVVKQADEKRQIQSMSLLERFNTKMGRASVSGILADKKIDVSDLPSQTQVIEMATLEEQGKLELDGEDFETDDWINHKLVAPEGMRRDAKDANLKDESEDWYAIDDPRNKMNVRRREGNSHVDK